MLAALLHHYFTASARRDPAQVAVVEPGRGSLTYGELDALSDRVRDHLVSQSVGKGDRVGLVMRKSADTVATILGVLKAGAAYVPVDASAPAARGAYILHNCGVKALYFDAEHETRLVEELEAVGACTARWPLKRGADAGEGLRVALDIWRHEGHVAPGASVEPEASDLAYILYTSGTSTSVAPCLKQT